MTPVLTKQRYAEGVSNQRVFLNLKKIKKVSVARSQEEANVGIVVVGKNLCPKKIEKDLKKYTHRHP